MKGPRDRLAIATLVALCAAPVGAQQAWAPGTRVEASPMQMQQFWEPCTIVSGPNQWDQYRAECNGYELIVLGMWIRPLSAASASPGATEPLTAAPPPQPPAAAPRPASAPSAAPPDAAVPSEVRTGNYECWAFSSARMDLNFEVTGPGRYIAAADGSEGTFSLDAGTGQIRFTGYLGDAMPDGFTAIYHEPRGTPTVSFRGRSGAEASFCENP